MAHVSKRLKKALELRKQFYNTSQTLNKVRTKLVKAVEELTPDERRAYSGPDEEKPDAPSQSNSNRGL